MKKWYTVGLLVLVVVFAASILLACESEETTSTEAVATAEATTADTAAAQEVSWEDAIYHEGETIAMVGPVVAVDDLGEGIGKYQLRIGSAEDGEGASAMITYDNAGAFDLESYKDMNVMVTGVVTVNPFELKAEIELTDPSQIEILSDVGANGGVDISTVGLYFEDQGNNVVMVTDVPAPGLATPIHTIPADDFAVTIEAFDADGNSLGNLDTEDGLVDYSSVADTVAKIVVTTFMGVEYEYMVP